MRRRSGWRARAALTWRPTRSNCSRRRATPTSASRPSTTAPTPCTSAGRRSARATRHRTRSKTWRGLVAHAHRYHARIFVTLNTILRDDELEGGPPPGLGPVQRRRRRADRAGHGRCWRSTCRRSSCTPARSATPHAGEGALPAGRRLLPDHAGARAARWSRSARCTRRSIARRWSSSSTARCAWRTPASASSAMPTPAAAPTAADCSQECRLPYTVTDALGRVVAHEKHVLSIKDNDQSANLARWSAPACAASRSRAATRTWAT